MLTKHYIPTETVGELEVVVVGSGLLASAFNDFLENFSTIFLVKNLYIFCSGVSTSKLATAKDCEREEALLNEMLKEAAFLIYFGSTVTDFRQEDPYYIHKKLMENLVIKSGKGIILRLPQVVGDNGNPSNLINYLIKCIKTDEEIVLNRSASRSLMHVDDVVALTLHCAREIQETTDKIINICFPYTVTVVEIYHYLCETLSKSPNAKYIVEEDCENLFISKFVMDAVSDNVVEFQPYYWKRVLNDILHSK
jgi:hypothetical protein